ncbi:MAG: metal-dependent hydrolase [Planctomycetes bacterium]|jgi:membrane-bound metal-dependent hydrolase YbcI (DUF457 family)|nr:metal-dependent hydrolase [Planctomycetota bacterium]
MFLDVAFGIFTAIFLSSFHEADLTAVLIAGIIFSLLPDADFVIYKLLGIHQDKGYKHRELFHYPLLYLGAGYIVIYFIFGQIIAWCFLISTFLHFLHDSIAYGRGIKWLYPFSNSGYAFIYLFSRVNKKGLWQKVFIFDQAYTDWFDREHGDEQWIRHIFYDLHPIAIIEFSVFILAMIWLIRYYF